MRRRTCLQAGTLACLPGLASGQGSAPPGAAVRQIGVLSTFPMRPQDGGRESDSFNALRRGLRERGWQEGLNLHIHHLNTGGFADRYAPMAAAMLQLPVEVIASAGPFLEHLQRLNTRMPVVMGGGTHPVEQGLVQSLARPGGLYTGLSNQGRELSVKRLEILAERVPAPLKLGVLTSRGSSSPSHDLPALRQAAARLGREWMELQAADMAEAEAALHAAARQRLGGLMVGGLLAHFRELNQQALRHRIALMFSLRQQRAGDEPADLISYAPDFPAIWYRAAYYVDRILRGTPPGDLPVEQPTQINLIINLRTARAIGLSVPDSLLLRATRIIE